MSSPSAELPEAVGPYLIREKIGSGGMGNVYLGQHTSTGTIAAVKVLPASMAREAGFVERFAREIESMRRLSNPHIVELYDSGVDGETYYYAMEYVGGETLTSRLRREGRIPWEQAISMGIQIAIALKAAHDAGIIHRDLKPSNLLIAQDGTIKLTDFGVAQIFAANRLTVTGGIVGTAEFMSPEQAEGKRVTRQSDLYALGAVLYAMVTGRPPFVGPTAIDVLKKHCNARFDSPRLFVPELPHWFEEIICQLLEKDPARRFPDALVVMRRLEQVLKKVELSRARPTDGIWHDGNTVTVVTADDGEGAGPATFMRQVVREELDRLDAGTPWNQLLNNTAVLVALLVLVIAGGVWWFWPRKLTPEQQFETGVALIEGSAGSDWSRARSLYFEPLLEQHPEWEERVAPYLEQVRHYELEKQIAGKPGLEKQVPRRRTEQERLLALAVSLHAAGDTPRAVEILDSLCVLLSGDSEQAELLSLAQKLLADWRGEPANRQDRLQWLADALQRASTLAEQGEAAEARRIWNSIITLYEHDPEAQASVNLARQALQQETASTP